MRVDFILANGSILLNCYIFKPEPKQGDASFTMLHDIYDAIQKIPWGRKMVYFQNESINGCFDVSQIKKYEFNKEDLQKAMEAN